MIGYFLSRMVQALVVVLLAFSITFGMVRLAPGGPFAEDRAVSPEILAAQERAYGLDAPLLVQYARALGLLLRGNLGPSYVYEGRTVNDLIGDALPISLVIGSGGLVIAILIGLPLGIIAALRRNSATDHLATGCAMLGICLPGFVLGPVLALVFGIRLNWFNASGWYDASDWLLPALTLGLFYAAYIARLARVGMLEVLGLDYIRTARAKGLSGFQVIGRHALRQAVLPVVSFLGPAMAGLVSGSIVVERVFQVPGLGYHFVGAALNRDYFLAQGTVVFYAALIVALNLVVDLVQAALDPRIRGKGGSRP